MVGRNIRVEYAECVDQLAANIRKHRIFDTVSLGEPLQDLARVISDRRRIDSVGLEIYERELQLDELIAAVWSPIRAAAEHQQQAVGSHQFIQRSGLTVLIGQSEIGNLLTDLGPGPVAVVLRLDKLEPIFGRDVRSTGAHPADHTVQD